MKKLFALVLIAFAVSSYAQAPKDQNPVGPADLIFKVSSAKGTYMQIAQQIAQVCSRPSISISTSDGQLALYNDLVTNKANIGLLTAPILIGKKTIENDTNVDKIVVVMPMYVAELHLVALRSSGNLNKFSDVGNKRVATYGGAFITARSFSLRHSFVPSVSRTTRPKQMRCKPCRRTKSTWSSSKSVSQRHGHRS
jgi:TRAP-type uncharacterized transport system substrate-binding protein